MTKTIVFADTTLPFLDVTLRIRDGWKSFLTKNHLPLYKFDQFFYMQFYSLKKSGND